MKDIKLRFDYAVEHGVVLHETRDYVLDWKEGVIITKTPLGEYRVVEYSELKQDDVAMLVRESFQNLLSKS